MLRAVWPRLSTRNLVSADTMVVVDVVGPVGGGGTETMPSDKGGVEEREADAMACDAAPPPDQVGSGVGCDLITY